MKNETRCQGCLQILSFSAGDAGKRGRCPHCKAEFVVPEETNDEALDSVCHFCGVAIPLGEAKQKFKTCSECEDSIQENQRELDQEELSRQQVKSQLAWIVWLLILIFAGSFVVRRLFRAPKKVDKRPKVKLLERFR